MPSGSDGAGGLRWTERALPWLGAAQLDAIFDCVYGVTDEIVQAHPVLAVPAFRDLVDTLLAMQQLNARHRTRLLHDYLPLFEEAFGPMERGAEGTWLWLGLGLALRDLYDLRRETLRDLLQDVTVRR